MLLNILISLLFFWSAILTFLTLRMLNHYNKLVKKTNKKNLTEMLEKLLNDEELNREEIKKIIEKIKKLEETSLFHFQKSSVFRFNPFSDVGSNQSFVLVLLDGLNNGFVLSSLHSRNHSRWYAKTVKNGKSQEHELSHEEQIALHEAMVAKK